MDIPPLFFDGSHLHGRPAHSIGYTVEKQALFGLPVGAKRNRWRLGIFECFSAQDSGLNCCCAQFCCGIWIWKNAISLVPHVEGEEAVLWQTVQQDVMRSARDAAAERGQLNVFADVFIAAQQAKTTFSRASVREQLFSVLYDDWEMVQDPTTGKMVRQVKAGGHSPHHENDGRRFLYVTCCPSCASVQVVDAIQTWSLETHGQPLKYGPITWDCKCCSLYTPYGAQVKSLPYPEMSAPVVSTMAR